jgi:hypothetical protein
MGDEQRDVAGLGSATARRICVAQHNYEGSADLTCGTSAPWGRRSAAKCRGGRLGVSLSGVPTGDDERAVVCL